MLLSSTIMQSKTYDPILRHLLIWVALTDGMWGSKRGKKRAVFDPVLLSHSLCFCF